MSILKQADKIVNERSEEKDRQYGAFAEGMERTTRIFNAMTNFKYSIKPEDMFKAFIAQKLAREAFSHKEDNLIDMVAYTEAMNTYIQEQDFNTDSITTTEKVVSKMFESLKKFTVKVDPSFNIRGTHTKMKEVSNGITNRSS